MQIRTLTRGLNWFTVKQQFMNNQDQLLTLGKVGYNRVKREAR